MNICTNCGSELRETAKFCTACGQPAIAETVLENTVDSNKNEVEYSEAVVESNGENVSEVTSENSEPATSFLDDVIGIFYDYIYFFKDTITKPSSILSQANGNWINGLISIILFSALIPFTMNIVYFQPFIEYLLFQAISVAILFAANHLMADGTDSFLDIVEKFGGLLNTQIILALLMTISLASNNGGLVGILQFAIIFNHFNISNLYVLDLQKTSTKKMDRYYQFIIFNIVLTIVAFIMVLQ